MNIIMKSAPRPPATKAVIWTVARLRVIKPGERMRYYRGDLAADIAKAQEAAAEGGAKGYAEVLMAVGAAARTLAMEKRAILSTEKRSTFEIDYIAEGI